MLADFNACDDFFDLATRCHVLAAALEVLEMETVDDIPSGTVIQNPLNVWMMPNEDRKTVLRSVANKITATYTSVFYTSTESTSPHSTTDQVHVYAKLLLTLGSNSIPSVFAYMEFSDAIRERDGRTSTTLLEVLAANLVGSGRKNYALESLYLVKQVEYQLPSRQAAELKWGRFNVHGLPGRNVPNDLHMEHLNRICKEAIKYLGSNKTIEAAITRVGRALGTIAPVLDSFDQENSVVKRSHHHKRASFERICALSSANCVVQKFSKQPKVVGIHLFPTPETPSLSNLGRTCSHG